MAGTPYAYTNRQVETLFLLRQQGFSYKEIAQRFPPRSPEAIRTYLYRYRKKRDVTVSLKVGEPLRANAPLSGS